MFGSFEITLQSSKYKKTECYEKWFLSGTLIKYQLNKQNIICFLDMSWADMKSGGLQAILINVLFSFWDFSMSHDDISTYCSLGIWYHSHCVDQM